MKKKEIKKRLGFVRIEMGKMSLMALWEACQRGAEVMRAITWLGQMWSRGGGQGDGVDVLLRKQQWHDGSAD